MRGAELKRSSPSLVSTSIGVVRSPPTQRMRRRRGGDAEWSRWTTRGRSHLGSCCPLVALSFSVLYWLPASRPSPAQTALAQPASLASSPSPKTLKELFERSAGRLADRGGSPEPRTSQVEGHRHLQQGLSPGRAESHGSRLERRCSTMGNLESLTF